LKPADFPVAEYEYDGQNRRIVKVDKTGMADVTYDSYHNEEWQTLEVRKDADADPFEQYVWHPHYIDAIVLRDYDAETDGSATRYYYAQDANFNVTAVTNSSGTVVERYMYSPYGELLVLDANFATDADGLSDIGNSVTYTGREFDAESGLYHYRNRFYHAQAGLFISRDPAGYQDGPNLCRAYFVPNHVDPRGLGQCAITVGGITVTQFPWSGHLPPGVCGNAAVLYEDATFVSHGTPWGVCRGNETWPLTITISIRCADEKRCSGFRTCCYRFANVSRTQSDRTTIRLQVPAMNNPLCWRSRTMVAAKVIHKTEIGECTLQNECCQIGASGRRSDGGGAGPKDPFDP